MPDYLDIESWKRRDQFYFFKEYDHPFFNICANVDVSRLHRFVKDQNTSFFKASLFLSLKSANNVEPFRYRLKNDEVVIYETIHAGSTVLNDDETFSFCYFDYFESYRQFEQNAANVLIAHRQKATKLHPQEDRDDLIHYSMIPWISFSSFAHARRFHTQDSIPKMVFGKFHEMNGKLKMPVSVEVHHALMDGIHVAKFFDNFQKLLNDPENSLV